MQEKTSFRDSALRAVAIVGLIAILVLGAWGIIQLVVGLPDFFSQFGGGSTTSTSQTTSSERVTVVAPSMVTSGQPFPLSWTHTGSTGNYSFSLSYSCADGLSFAAPTPTGQYQQVPCNTPFNYTNAATNMQLVAVLAPSAKQTQTTITTSATRLSDNKVTSSNTANITVLPAATTQPAATQTQTTPASTRSASSGQAYTPSGRTSNLYGSADLAVRILSASPVGGRYQVEFEVSNVGTNVAPYGWEFNAQLPTNPSYTYTSPSQQKLYPGDRIVYTLGFDMQNNYGNQNYGYGYQNSYGYQNYGNTFSVTVDPQYLINDYNRGNNSASVTLGY